MITLNILNVHTFRIFDRNIFIATPFIKLQLLKEFLTIRCNAVIIICSAHVSPYDSKSFKVIKLKQLLVSKAFDSVAEFFNSLIFCVFICNLLINLYIFPYFLICFICCSWSPVLLLNSATRNVMCPYILIILIMSCAYCEQWHTLHKVKSKVTSGRIVYKLISPTNRYTQLQRWPWH